MVNPAGIPIHKVTAVDVTTRVNNARTVVAVVEVRRVPPVGIRDNPTDAAAATILVHKTRVVVVVEVRRVIIAVTYP